MTSYTRRIRLQSVESMTSAEPVTYETHKAPVWLSWTPADPAAVMVTTEGIDFAIARATLLTSDERDAFTEGTELSSLAIGERLWLGFTVEDYRVVLRGHWPSALSWLRSTYELCSAADEKARVTAALTAELDSILSNPPL